MIESIINGVGEKNPEYIDTFNENAAKHNRERQNFFIRLWDSTNLATYIIKFPGGRACAMTKFHY